MALAAPAPAGVLPTGAQAIRVGEDGPCPDIVVSTTVDYETDNPADAVLLVAEVTSPSSRRTDTVTELDLYARAGIPHYWIVDPEEIAVYELDPTSGGYQLRNRAGSVEVPAPFPVSVGVVRPDLGDRPTRGVRAWENHRRPPGTRRRHEQHRTRAPTYRGRARRRPRAGARRRAGTRPRARRRTRSGVIGLVA